MEPVSRRCIEKDLVTLECAPYEASIERVWYCGKKCIRYEEDGFSIFTKKLTKDEENLLSEVLNTIGQFDGLDTFEWLDGLKRRQDIKEHRRIIEFDSNPYFSGRNLIGSLFTAISNKQVIALKYHTFKNPEIKEVVVYPYLLKEYNKRWFLIVGLVDGTILNFALDRIDWFKPMPHIDYVEPDEGLESRFDDIVGVTLHGSQRNVKGDEEKLLREKFPILQGGCFFRMKCILNYEIEQLFMSKMDQVVVLEPSVLSDSLRERIKKLNMLYSNI